MRRYLALAILAAVTSQTVHGVSEQIPAFAGRLTGQAQPPQDPLCLWYDRPATAWTEALALGNGRLGAMVPGGIVCERICLTEDTLWASGPYDPTKQMPYQPVGELILTFPQVDHVSEYRRDLDLDTAVATVSYRVGQVRHIRQVLVSPADQVIVLRLSADKPGQVSFTATMESPHQVTLRPRGDAELEMAGTNGGAHGIQGTLGFQARLKVITQGGTIHSDAGSVNCRQADTALLLIAIGTSFCSFKDVTGDPAALVDQYLTKASAKSFDELLGAHVREHQRLFRRVSLDLGTSHANRLTTDERIRRFPTADDPQLAVLYFQFGRYLLISSSRPGTEPAHPRGIWSYPAGGSWDSTYTINANTQMNYWPMEVTNLAECAGPLVQMIMDLAQTGTRTAKGHYGAGGWVAHQSTDLWRASGPTEGAHAGLWPTGGAWLCTHLWEHYLFTQDKEFLAVVYPVMKGAAEFFLQTLVEHPRYGYLVTCPSVPAGDPHPAGTGICAGPMLDSQVIRDLFGQCIEASKILAADTQFRYRATAARARLAPNKVASDGRLQQCLDESDANAPQWGCGNLGHLYGLYPSNQITPEDTPELAQAARRSLEACPDAAAGWALAWRMNLWARLKDAERAYKMLELLLNPDRTCPNMFGADPPLQIDGNLGATAAIAEMLLQSHTRQIELLPALPKAWPAGHVRGLRARGGFEVEIWWHDGRLTRSRVTSLAGQDLRISYRRAAFASFTRPGEVFLLDDRLQRIER